MTTGHRLVPRAVRGAGPRRAARAAALLALVLVALPAATASADHRLASTFQDDARILSSRTSVRDATLDEARSLGVTRVRVAATWRSIAPAADQAAKPAGFDGSAPDAYPAAGWKLLDGAIAAIRQRGMTVDLNPTAPAPTWAGSGATDPRLAGTSRPSPSEFGAFVTALGRRYGGDFVPAGQTAKLPRVGVWSIWDEPNQAARLSPQWTGTGASAREASPALYRDLLDAAWTGLQASGHATTRGDVVLVGETAPKGVQPASKVRATSDSMPPLAFLRRLYCVDDRSVPLQGAAATAVGCPAVLDEAAFAAQHPALFAMTGYAHHPYELAVSPAHAPEFPEAYVTLANLDALTGQLDRLMTLYGAKRADVPLYLTEYGYQTNPPDDVAPSLTQQAAWINEAEYLAWKNPRVRTLSQSLLYDDGPVPGVTDPDAKWATFQTGLRFGPGSGRTGEAKPSLDAYRIALFLPRTAASRAGRLRIWGRVRPSGASAQPGGSAPARRVDVQVRRGRKGAFRRLTTYRTDRYGFVSRSIRVAASGAVRLSWTDGGTRYVSRVVPFTARAR